MDDNDDDDEDDVAEWCCLTGARRAKIMWLRWVRSITSRAGEGGA